MCLLAYIKTKQKKNFLQGQNQKRPQMINMTYEICKLRGSSNKLNCGRRNTNGGTDRVSTVSGRLQSIGVRPLGTTPGGSFFN